MSSEHLAPRRGTTRGEAGVATFEGDHEARLFSLLMTGFLAALLYLAATSFPT